LDLINVSKKDNQINIQWDKNFKFIF
jgi:hypothetical protein